MNTLLLDIQAQSLSSFRVFDVSCYDDIKLVTNGILEVYTPSSIKPVIQRVDPLFTEIYNSTNLKISSSFKNLPDGAYTIKYSVSPNSKTHVTYTYYRVNLLDEKYKSNVISLFETKCEINGKDYYKKLDTLSEIKDFILASKLVAEEKHDIETANKLYQEACDLLENYKGKC